MSNRVDHFIGTQTKPAFLKKLQTVVEANLQNDQFSVEVLAEQMNMSRSNLHRKLKQTTGQTANQFIREYRLEWAMELLKKADRPISEVAYEVGFGSPSYFTSCFTEHYGYPPGEAKFRASDTDQPKDSGKGQSCRFKVPTKVLALVGLVAIGLVVLVFLVQWQATGSEEVGIREQSVAVLPLKNLNLDQEYEYFSEGVVQAINRHLSQVEDLKVISLTSTDRYRETNLSAQQIGKELEVASLLEGSIQRQDNTVRIEVRLVNASNGQQIWAESYDKELEDIFKTQSEIAEQVALSLKSTLSTEEKQVLTQKATSNIEAYDLYLKGFYEYNTYTRNGVHNAIEYFKQAIALDSNYAQPYSGLATAYIASASIFGAELTAFEGLQMAKPLIEKALAIDPNLVEAHTINAFYLLYHDWDFEGAERAYRRGVEVNNTEALALYADYLNFIRRHDKALMIDRRLDEIDPYFLNSRMIIALYYNKKYDEAVDFAESRIKVFNNYYTLDNYGFLMLNTGDYPRAIELFQQVMNIEGIRYPRILGWMGATYAHSGQKNKARELIDELEEKLATNDAGSIRFFMAVIYSALGDKDTALQWLQAAYEEHEMEMPWLISEPQFYNLHSEPEFQQLVAAMGFPAYSAE